MPKLPARLHITPCPHDPQKPPAASRHSYSLDAGYDSLEGNRTAHPTAQVHNHKTPNTLNGCADILSRCRNETSPELKRPHSAGSRPTPTAPQPSSTIPAPPSPCNELAIKDVYSLSLASMQPSHQLTQLKNAKASKPFQRARITHTYLAQWRKTLRPHIALAGSCNRFPMAARGQTLSSKVSSAA